MSAPVRTVRFDLSTPQAVSLMNYIETLPFAEIEQENKTFEDAVAECDGRPASEFFDELRKQVKEHFSNAKSYHPARPVGASGRTS